MLRLRVNYLSSSSKSTNALESNALAPSFSLLSQSISFLSCFSKHVSSSLENPSLSLISFSCSPSSRGETGTDARHDIRIFCVRINSVSERFDQAQPTGENMKMINARIISFFVNSSMSFRFPLHTMEDSYQTRKTHTFYRSYNASCCHD